MDKDLFFIVTITIVNILACILSMVFCIINKKLSSYSKREKNVINSKCKHVQELFAPYKTIAEELISLSESNKKIKDIINKM